MLANMARPSSTAATIEAKLSSASTMSAASFDTSVPVMPIATPISAVVRCAIALAVLALFSCRGRSILEEVSNGAAKDGGVLGPCTGNFTSCAGMCFNTQTSFQHCGGCSSPCAGNQVCSVGRCASTCEPGLSACGASCVAFQSDVDHCGRCDNGCPGGQVCASGNCTCGTGGTLCFGSCVDVTSSPTDCGACGKSLSGGDGLQCRQVRHELQRRLFRVRARVCAPRQAEPALWRLRQGVHRRLELPKRELPLSRG